jgi:hypothetical protein
MSLEDFITVRVRRVDAEAVVVGDGRAPVGASPWRLRMALRDALIAASREAPEATAPKEKR